MSYNSTLADVIRHVERCTESELRQIHALIGARLGVPTSNTSPGNPAGRSGSSRDPAFAKRPKTFGSKSKSPAHAKRVASSGNNPKGKSQKRSQFATHPDYLAYSRARKAMRDKAKEDKVSFGSITGELRDNYTSALDKWSRAKSLFRGKTPIEKASSIEEGEVIDTTTTNPIHRQEFLDGAQGNLDAQPSGDAVRLMIVRYFVVS